MAASLGSCHRRQVSKETGNYHNTAQELLLSNVITLIETVRQILYSVHGSISKRVSEDEGWELGEVVKSLERKHKMPRIASNAKFLCGLNISRLANARNRGYSVRKRDVKRQLCSIYIYVTFSTCGSVVNL